MGELAVKDVLYDDDAILGSNSERNTSVIKQIIRLDSLLPHHCQCDAAMQQQEHKRAQSGTIAPGKQLATRFPGSAARS